MLPFVVVQWELFWSGRFPFWQCFGFVAVFPPESFS
jgi:hypothetical protein